MTSLNVRVLRLALAPSPASSLKVFRRRVAGVIRDTQRNEILATAFQLKHSNDRLKLAG